uniref:Putative actin-9 n=1 Tax=Schistocephalus solidus TaxID=70667 RepID=A0A0V0JBC6_SCHSO
MPPTYKDYSRNHEVTVGELYTATRPPTSRGKENIPDPRRKTNYASGDLSRRSNEKPNRTQKLDQSLQEHNDLLYQQPLTQQGRRQPGPSTVRSFVSVESNDTGTYQEVQQTCANDYLSSAEQSKQFVSLELTELPEVNHAQPLQSLSNGSSTVRDDFYAFKGKDYTVLRNAKPTQFPYESPAATAKEKKKTVVIDLGSCFVRAGVLRHQPAPPEVCFPTVLSFRSHSNKSDFSNGAVAFVNQAIAVGDKVFKTLFSETPSGQKFIFPLRQNRIGEATAHEYPDIEISILREVFAKLHIDPADYKVLLTLPTRASALRPNFLAALFSEFGVSAVAIMSAFRAALQTAKTSTCLVINFGCDLEILPVCQGSLIEGGRSLVGQFGENIVNNMLANLIDVGVITTKEETLCFSQYIFKRAAFVDNDALASEDIEIDMSEFGCKSTKNLRISAELRKVSTEGIFKPSKTNYFDPNAPSLTKLLRQSLKACPMEFRQDLCTNVLLVGEYATIEGLQHRIVTEMQRFLPKSTRLAVKTVPDSAEAAYIGGCLTCAILQGPKAPECDWFRFMEPAMWNSIKASAPGGRPLVDRLNAEMCWP